MQLSIGRNKLVGDAIWTFSGNAAARFISGMFTIVLARLVGLESYGVFVLALTVAAIVVQFADFGLQQNFLRLASGQPKDIESLEGASVWLRVFLSGLAIVGFLIVANLSMREDYIFAIALLVIPYTVGTSLFNHRQGALLAAQNMRGAAIQRISNTVIVLGCSLVAISIVGWGRVDAEKINLSYGIGALSAGVISVATLASGSRLRFDRHKAAQLLTGIGGFFWTGILYVVSPQVPILILQAFASPAILGAFALAYRLPTVLALIPLSVSQSFYPKLFANRARAVVYRELLRTEAVCVVTLASILSVSLDFLSPWLLSTLLGPETARPIGLSTAFSVIAWLLTIQSVSLPFAHVLMTSGRQGMRASVQAFVLVLATVPCYVASKQVDIEALAYIVAAVEGVSVIAYATVAARFVDATLVRSIISTLIPWSVIMILSKSIHLGLIRSEWTGLMANLILLSATVTALIVLASTQLNKTRVAPLKT